MHIMLVNYMRKAYAAYPTLLYVCFPFATLTM